MTKDNLVSFLQSRSATNNPDKTGGNHSGQTSLLGRIQEIGWNSLNSHSNGRFVLIDGVRVNMTFVRKVLFGDKE